MWTKANTAPASAFPYRELGVLVAAQFTYGLCWSTFLLLPKFLTLELGAGPGEIGQVSAVPGLTAALAVPFVGRLIDRVGRKSLITSGALLIALTAFGFTAVDRLGPLLYALQFCTGLSFVLTFNAAGVHAADLAPPDRLGQVLGVFGASNVVTNAIAPGIFEPIASAHGWRTVFFAAGVLGVLASLLAQRIREPSMEARRAEAAAARALSSSEPKRPDHSFKLYTAAMTAQGAAFAVAFTFYQPFAISLGMREVRSFFIGFALSVLLARVGLGSVPDRFGRKRVAVAALVLYAAAELGMSQLTPGTLGIYGALLGLGHGFFYPAINALAVEHSKKAERGKVMTYLNGGFQVGATLGVLLFGRIAERSGYPLIFVLAAVLVGFAAVVLARTRSPVVQAA